MAAKEPLPGPGQFQWNAGGWFGSQVGGTAWMLVGAAVLIPQTPLIAAWWACCFALANAAGAWLWLRRDVVRPNQAIQALLAACGVAGLLAVVVLHALGPAEVALGVGWREGRVRLENPPGDTLLAAYASLLLGVPALMGWLAVLEWSARRARSGA